MSNNYACKDHLWGKCGALGDALRRASEAEREVAALNLESAQAFCYWAQTVGYQSPHATKAWGPLLEEFLRRAKKEV